MLSPSTQDFDQNDQFEDYRQIDTLEEYVVISQEQPQVKCRRQIDQSAWDIPVFLNGDRVKLQSIDLGFPMKELYRGLD